MPCRRNWRNLPFACVLRTGGRKKKKKKKKRKTQRDATKGCQYISGKCPILDARSYKWNQQCDSTIWGLEQQQRPRAKVARGWQCRMRAGRLLHWQLTDRTVFPQNARDRFMFRSRTNSGWHDAHVSFVSEISGFVTEPTLWEIVSGREGRG